jgi:hypothetical protein
VTDLLEEFATWADESEQVAQLYGLELIGDVLREDDALVAAGTPEEWELYGLPPEDHFYGLVSSAHWWCAVGEFCRNPLHPGPCKGWKHMLHSVAPGAYHAYEKDRVAKLNEKRKAKIAALKVAGKPVPKYLEKEITYAPVPKAPEGTPFHAPTPEQAKAALPATKAEIEKKLADQHAAKSKAKLADQQAAIINMMNANLGAVMGPVKANLVKKKVEETAAALKPGEKLADQPVIENALKKVAHDAAVDAELGPDQEAELLGNLKQHVNAGVPDLPLLLQSAHQKAKDATALKAKKALLGKQFDSISGLVDAMREAKGHGPAPASFKQSVKDALLQGGVLSEGKKPSEVEKVDKLISALAKKAVAEGDLPGGDLKKLEYEIRQHVDAGKKGVPLLLSKHLDAMKTKVAQPEAPAGKVTGPLAHPAMMHVVDLAKDPKSTSGEFLDALSKEGVNKEEFDKLAPATKAGIIGKLIVAHDGGYQASSQIAAEQIGVGDQFKKIVYGAPGKAEKPSPPAAGGDLPSAVKLAGTSKQKVTALKKMTKEQFDALSPDTKKAIQEDLNEAYAKFLDPNKKGDVQELAFKFGLPDPHTAAGHQAGAGGTVTGKVTGAQMTKAQMAVVSLSSHPDSEAYNFEKSPTMQDLASDPASISIWEDAAKDGTADQKAEKFATAASNAWATHHLSGLPLSGSEQDAIKAKAAAEFKHMILTGETKPPPGGVLQLAKVTSMYSAPTTKAGALKGILGLPGTTHVNPPQAGAGGSDLAAEAKKILSEPNLGYYAKVSKLTKAHFDALSKDEQTDIIVKLQSLKQDVSPENKAKYDALGKKLLLGEADGAADVAPAAPTSGTVTSIPAVKAAPVGKLLAKSTVDAQQMHKSYVAVAMLAGGQGGQTKLADVEQAFKGGKQAKQEFGQTLVNGLSGFWMSQKYSGAVPSELSEALKAKGVSGGEIESTVKAKVASEVEQMLADGLESPPAGGVLALTAKGEHDPAVWAKALGVKYTPPPPGKTAFKVEHTKTAKIMTDPHGSKNKQVVAVGQAAKVNAWNKLAASAAKGHAGHEAGIMSIGAMSTMYDKKLGTVKMSDAKNALMSYTGSGYIDINEALRTADASGELPGGVIGSRIKSIDAAMQHSKLDRDVLIYRGISNGAAAFGQHWSHSKSLVGLEAYDPGYASHSTEYSTSKSFAGSGSGSVVFRVLARKGTPAISAHGGTHSSENELILPRGMKLRVVADNGWQNGARQLDVEIVKA